MLRVMIAAVYIFATFLVAEAQTPGVDPRGVALSSSPVIIGIVEEPWQKVMRPDNLSNDSVKVIPQADGSKIVAFPPISRDYLVGYIYHVRVQEVLKGEPGVTINQIVKVFVAATIEGGVSFPPKQRFLIALDRFDPDKEVFSKTSVSRTTDIH